MHTNYYFTLDDISNRLFLLVVFVLDSYGSGIHIEPVIDLIHVWAETVVCRFLLYRHCISTGR
jgi:hypothetical protein